MDWRKCHFCCGRTGKGVSDLGSIFSGTKGMSTGVGLPIVSVNNPIWLWKYGLVRKPPFHQVEYVAPERDVTPGFASNAKRVCIAAPISSRTVITIGSRK